MASQSFFDVEHANREVKIVSGRISIGASGAPTVAEGLGFSIIGGSGSALSAGQYRLTLDKTYTGFLFGGVEFNALGVTQFALGRVLNHNVTGDKTINLEFRNYDDDDTPALEELLANSEFTFCLVLRDGDAS